MSNFAQFKKKQKKAAGQTFILCLNILHSLTTKDTSAQYAGGIQSDLEGKNEKRSQLWYVISGFYLT